MNTIDYNIGSSSLALTNIDEPKADLMCQISNLMTYLSSKKLIKSSVNQQAKEILDKLQGLMIISEEEFDTVKKDVKELKKEQSIIGKVISENKVKDIAQEYVTLKSEYEVLRSKTIKSSMELTSAIQRNTNLSIQLTSVDRNNEFLSKQLEECYKEIDKLKKENKSLLDIMNPESTPIISGEHTLEEITQDHSFEELSITYFTETLNQYIQSNSHIGKTNSLEEATNRAIQMCNDKSVKDHIYIISRVDSRVLSRYNVNEKLENLKIDPFISNNQFDHDTLIKLISDDITLTNQTIYENVKKSKTAKSF